MVSPAFFLGIKSKSKMKIRKRLIWEKAGQTHDVEVVGSQKSIDRLCRNLETTSGVDNYEVKDLEE